MIDTGYWCSKKKYVTRRSVRVSGGAWWWEVGEINNVVTEI
jgi:hypothetical protein